MLRGVTHSTILNENSAIMNRNSAIMNRNSAIMKETQLKVLVVGFRLIDSCYDDELFLV